MSDILSNCRFIFTQETPLVHKRKLELILLHYNKGWGSNLSKTTIATESITESIYFWVVDGVIWQSNLPYTKFDYLPILDLKEVLEKY